MESLDFAYKLVDLKIKSKAPGQIYFMSQVFQEHSHCYDKRKNKKTDENYENIFIYFCCYHFPLRTGWLHQPPDPKRFTRQKVLKIFFIDTWVSEQRVGKLTVWQS